MFECAGFKTVDPDVVRAVASRVYNRELFAVRREAGRAYDSVARWYFLFFPIEVADEEMEVARSVDDVCVLVLCWARVD